MFYSRLQVICDLAFAEILMAEIAESGFDTFMENETGFEAYAEGNNFDKEKLQSIKHKYSQHTTLLFYQERIEKKNWNEEWEKSYQPIVVEDRLMVRAGFHQPEKKYPLEIIITPKMSFGTGHHQTTYLMMKAQLAIDHTHKIVMDAGTGTGVLAILASKLGAATVEAFDVDDWSVENGSENITINQCANITIRKGKVSDLTFSDNFDIILANINKNILLDEIHLYAAYLTNGGVLILSGFYEKDIPDLMEEAQRYKLEYKTSDAHESWAVLMLQKPAH